VIRSSLSNSSNITSMVTGDRLAAANGPSPNQASRLQAKPTAYLGSSNRSAISICSRRQASAMRRWSRSQVTGRHRQRSERPSVPQSRRPRFDSGQRCVAPAGQLMSALGQLLTSERSIELVCFVPKADVVLRLVDHAGIGSLDSPQTMA